jgi:hypothetical protein
MSLINVLRDEEVRSTHPVFVRELVDITKANNIVEAMLDTPNRRMEYSDIVITFNKDKYDLIKINKSKFCETGLYFSEKYYLEELDKWKKRERELIKDNLEFISEIETLKNELNEYKTKKKSATLSSKIMKKIFGT